ncbi:MAG: hypothetical protein K8S55_13665 [Phycisphaerae bacterium]|nr:hypothetical protein [Phycisphaerae bacterium]
MPKKKTNELKAGIFVMVALAVMLGVILWMGAADIFDTTKSRAVFYSDVKDGSMGLLTESSVMVGDVKIGKITSVYIDHKSRRVIYETNINQPGFEIHTDGKAKVKAGFLGGSMLVITFRGSKDAALADSSHPIHVEAGGFDEVMNSLKDISTTLGDELDASKKASLLAQIKQVVAKLLEASEDVAKITHGLAPQLDPKQSDSIAANLATTMKNLAATSTTIDKYVQKDLGGIIVNVRKIATSVLKTANHLDVSTEKLKLILVENADSIDAMIDNMVAVSANLKSASTEIRRNPWRLFYKPDDKKMRSVNLYDAARAFDDGANQLNTAVIKLKSLQGLDPKDPTTAKEIQRVKKNLLESFKKFKKVEEALWKEVGK